LITPIRHRNKIRNTNIESGPADRNKFKTKPISNPENLNAGFDPCCLAQRSCFVFHHFEFVSNFGFCVSNLVILNPGVFAREYSLPSGKANVTRLPLPVSLHIVNIPPRAIALISASRLLYIVHMKNVNASEARKNWFRLLDEALRGEVIVVERKGRRLVLRREELNDKQIGTDTGRYKKLLRVPKADEADRWSWEWKGPAGSLVARRRGAR